MTRRGLLPRLPQMTKFYGLRPCDLDAMTLREVVEYVSQMDDYLAKNGG